MCFNNGNSKLKKCEKRIDHIKQKIEDLMAEYDSLNKKYESMTNEFVEQSPHEEPKTSKENDENLCETLQKQIEEKDAIIADYEKQVAELKEQLNEQAVKEPVVEPKETDAMQWDNMQKILESIKEVVANLASQINNEHQQLLKENSDIQELLDQKQERLEQITQTCHEDRYKKDKIKLVNKYIYQMDLIRKALYDFDSRRTERSDKESVAFLENQLKSIVVSMEATLAQEMVEPIQYGEDGGTVNPELQETIDVFDTNDPELDGKIYSSINPGYVWTLPYILKAKITDNGDEIKSYRFLVRPEQIIVYRLNK